MSKICIWGTGVNALNFSVMCDDEIVAYIDNYPRANFFELNDKPVVLSKDSSHFIRNYFIVVASTKDTYWIIKKQLENEGLEEFKNFCYYTNYKKKVVVLYGNCHMQSVQEALIQNNIFSGEYGIYPLHFIHEIKNQNREYELDSPCFAYCDLLIHQDIRDENSYGLQFASSKIIPRVKKSCHIIAVPNLYGLPKYYFPQIGYGLMQKNVLGYTYFPFRDSIIEKLYKNEKKNISYIADTILYGSVFNENSLKVAWLEFLNKIVKREKTWDVKISEMLNKYNSHNHLFYDINHPTEKIIGYIAKEILEKININGYAVNENTLPKLDIYEIPVYGQVMDYFSMKWSNEYILRKGSKYSLSGRCINLNDYVEQYIKWNC
jgi:hypothetical protein